MDTNERIERALCELVDKIVPGLDTGDILADARTASDTLDAVSVAHPVAIVYRKGFGLGSISWTKRGIAADLPDNAPLYAATDVKRTDAACPKVMHASIGTEMGD